MGASVGAIIYSNVPGIYAVAAAQLLSFMPFYHFFKLSLLRQNHTRISREAIILPINL
jgi:hypothetical protein